MGGKTSNMKKKISYEMENFLSRKLTIFWIMGPAGCGKSTLAQMLSMCSKYYLIRVSKIIKDEANKHNQRSKIVADCIKRGQYVYNDIVITLIQETMFSQQSSAKGYIIDGFPMTLKQGIMFEQTVCRPNLIIYVTLVLDTLLGRLVGNNGNANLEKARQVHILRNNQCSRVFRRYPKVSLKVVANFPAEDTVTKLVTDLEDFWGYKFERLFNRN